MDYANAKFLIYTSWEIDIPYKIAGSLLLNGALTEEEAKEKVEIYKARHYEYDIIYRTKFIYIVNKAEWWTNYPRVPVEPHQLGHRFQDLT
jgi:hypothetical protein